jgi:(2Fe-2S) ferredoxin
MAEPGKFDRHVFVCLNERPGGPDSCCKARGGEAVHARFKDQIRARGLRGRMRANRAGCLSTCDHGVTVVVYPDNVWYGGVRPEDVDEIVDSHLLGGVPVHRLRIPDSELRPPPEVSHEE